MADSLPQISFKVSPDERQKWKPWPHKKKEL